MLDDNLIEDVGSASGFGATGDQTSVDPDLGSRQDNGGPTETHALNPTSPAIDAGDHTGAPATDQRGRDRIVNLVVDIGAYEYQGELLLGAFDPLRRVPSDSLASGQADQLFADALRQWEVERGGPLGVDVRLETASLRGQHLAAGEVLEFDAAGRPVQARVVLDLDAAGLGWHTSRASLPNASHYDMFTVMLHEVGHILGLDHSSDGRHTSLMDATLAPGVRLLPAERLEHGVGLLYSDPLSLALDGSVDLWLGFLPSLFHKPLTSVLGRTTEVDQHASDRQLGPSRFDRQWAEAVDELFGDSKFQIDHEGGRRRGKRGGR